MSKKATRKKKAGRRKKAATSKPKKGLVVSDELDVTLYMSAPLAVGRPEYQPVNIEETIDRFEKDLAQCRDAGTFMPAENITKWIGRMRWALNNFELDTMELLEVVAANADALERSPK